jgi:hypothetical protein
VINHVHKKNSRELVVNQKASVGKQKLTWPLTDALISRCLFTIDSASATVNHDSVARSYCRFPLRCFQFVTVIRIQPCQVHVTVREAFR